MLELGAGARGVLLAPGSNRGTDGALDVAEHRVDSLESPMVLAHFIDRSHRIGWVGPLPRKLQDEHRT